MCSRTGLLCAYEHHTSLLPSCEGTCAQQITLIALPVSAFYLAHVLLIDLTITALSLMLQ